MSISHARVVDSWLHRASQSICLSSLPWFDSSQGPNVCARLAWQAIERQAAAGAAEADVLVMVVDGQAGVTAADEEIATWLRRTHPRTPVLLAVNKCENARLADVQVRSSVSADGV